VINKITLNNTEIEKAIENYVRTLISIAPGQKIVIDMKAGRGENGYSATLDILPADPVEILPGAFQRPTLDQVAAEQATRNILATTHALLADPHEQQTVEQVFKDVAAKGREAISSLAKTVNEVPDT